MDNMKLVVHWWEDSGGRHTCHRNEKGLPASESVLGWMVHRPDGWYITVAETATSAEYTNGPWNDVYTARRNLMDLLNACVLDYN